MKKLLNIHITSCQQSVGQDTDIKVRMSTTAQRKKEVKSKGRITHTEKREQGNEGNCETTPGFSQSFGFQKIWLIFSTKSNVDKIKAKIENNDDVQSIDIKYVL